MIGLTPVSGFNGSIHSSDWVTILFHGEAATGGGVGVGVGVGRTVGVEVGIGGVVVEEARTRVEDRTELVVVISEFLE